MARFGFCGASYSSQSPNVAADVTMNLYPENVESGDGKTPVAMYPTPGMLNVTGYLFNPVPLDGVQALFTTQGRVFAVTNGQLWELRQVSPAITTLGNINTTAGHVSVAIGLTQVLIVSSGQAYVLTLSNNAFTNVTSLLANPTGSTGPFQATWSDGFFFVLFGSSNEFQISAPENALSWNGLDVAEISVYPENCLSMFADHREIWFFGSKATQVYFNSGSANFPFAPVPGGYIEQGIVAPWSVVKMDNSIFWLGGDERGIGVAWRANGYNPLRVSNHAVEYAWSQYPTISDAIGYSYQDQGHTFWVIYFPSGSTLGGGNGATWVYDAATSQWHQRGFWNNGVYDAHRSRSHVMTPWGIHLIGDWAFNQVYQMTINSPYDLGSGFGKYEIRRMRRAPHISSEQEWIFHHKLQVDLQEGLDPSGTITFADGGTFGPGSVPTVNLRWSDDGGNTWSNYHTGTVGSVGNYLVRTQWRQLGRSRDRIYELTMTDPIPWRLADAYLKAEPGFQPSERLSKQLQKIA